MGKVREYWLHKTLDGPWTVHTLGMVNQTETPIHVIEYSVYSELLDKYEELLSYLPKVPTEPYQKEMAKQINLLHKQLTEVIAQRNTYHSICDFEGLTNKTIEQLDKEAGLTSDQE